MILAVNMLTMYTYRFYLPVRWGLIALTTGMFAWRIWPGVKELAEMMHRRNVKWLMVADPKVGPKG